MGSDVRRRRLKPSTKQNSLFLIYNSDIYNRSLNIPGFLINAFYFLGEKIKKHKKRKIGNTPIFESYHRAEDNASPNEDSITSDSSSDTD